MLDIPTLALGIIIHFWEDLQGLLTRLNFIILLSGIWQDLAIQRGNKIVLWHLQVEIIIQQATKISVLAVKQDIQMLLVRGTQRLEVVLLIILLGATMYLLVMK